MTSANSFVRKPKFKSIIASAINTDLTSRKAVKNVLAKRQDWQRQAIEDVRAIGELAYGITVPSSLISRTTLFAATLPNELDAEPQRIKEGEPNYKLITETIDRLGNQLARSDLQFDLAFNLLSVGECYLICFGERPGSEDGDIPATPEHWEIRSINEVSRKNKTVEVYDQLRDEKVILDHSKGDTFIRVWRPDPYNHDLAWSNVRAILTPAEELLWWDAAAQAAAKNRMTLAGLVGFPDDLEVRAAEGDDPRMTGSERFLTRWMETAMTAVRNPNDAAAAVPMAFSYPRNDSGKSGVDVISFDRPGDELLENRTEKSLIRMEQGINLPVGVISGLGQTTHWGGGQVEESVFRDHVEPTVILMCSALTRAFLLPILLEAGVKDADKYFIWYDASNLIIHRDRAANALRAIELGGIGWKAARRELGFSETDKPSPEEREEILEWLQGVRGRGPKEATVENPTEVTEVPDDPNAPPKENAPGKRSPQGKEQSGPMKGKGQDPVAASLRLVDELAVAQIQLLCDEKCRRALERAGNRLRNRAKKNSAYTAAINRVSPMEVGATLGREAVTGLGMNDLFDDAFTDLNSRICSILPGDILALDTITPINELISELRVLCMEHLFKPPSPSERIVPIHLIEHTIADCTKLSIDPVPA